MHKKHMSAETARTLSHRVGRLDERDLQAYEIITEGGPVLQLGEMRFAPEVWREIPRYYLWFAIDMHECGYWGPVCDVDYANNERALSKGGSVVSRWEFPDLPAFWIATDTSSPGNKTNVFVAQESV